MGDSCRLRGRVDARRGERARVACEECGEVVHTIREHTHAMRLEALECTWDIKDGLGAGAHDHHGGAPELADVSLWARKHAWYRHGIGMASA